MGGPIYCLISARSTKAKSIVSDILDVERISTRAAERGGLEGQAALGAKKRGAPKSGGREKKNRN